MTNTTDPYDSPAVLGRADSTEGDEQSPVKTCRRCGQQKPITEFCGHAHTADRLHSYCRACHGATISAARLQGREARAQLANAPLPDPLSTEDERDEMFMLLVHGFNAKTKYLEGYFGKDSPQFKAQMAKVSKACDKLFALMREDLPSPTGEPSPQTPDTPTPDG